MNEYIFSYYEFILIYNFSMHIFIYKIHVLEFVVGSDFVTMIQIDCAVTDTKTLHIRDNTHFKNNISSNIKQHHGIK